MLGLKRMLAMWGMHWEQFCVEIRREIFRRLLPQVKDWRKFFSGGFWQVKYRKKTGFWLFPSLLPWSKILQEVKLVMSKTCQKPPNDRGFWLEICQKHVKNLCLKPPEKCQKPFFLVKNLSKTSRFLTRKFRNFFRIWKFSASGRAGFSSSRAFFWHLTWPPLTFFGCVPGLGKVGKFWKFLSNFGQKWSFLGQNQEVFD